jgi:glyoxylase-like metal-dependent hydrolase (beta-lactamase superfamily II)
MAEQPLTVQPRTERIIPGVWRLRLPCPWPGVPHGNAWAIQHGAGIVLFDTGMGGPGRLRMLDLALGGIGWGVEDISLLVCTHSHADHSGLAASIIEAAGCELWMNPRWDHIRLMADSPEAALERRLEVARQSGVPDAALERYREARAGQPSSEFDGTPAPDRPLVDGIEVETDLGAWRAYETPGHAPSHVCLHQPERRLLISGDHLLGRTVLFFDYGHSPDPLGEYLASLDKIEPLAVDLCLAGHGKPFRDPAAKIAESRRQSEELLERVRAQLREGERTAFEIVESIVGRENLRSSTGGFMLQIVLAALDHLAVRGEATKLADTDPQRWALA